VVRASADINTTGYSLALDIAISPSRPNARATRDQIGRSDICKSELKPGAKIFMAAANKKENGTLEAATISVSRDGMPH
jgi:hypothetical protein